METKSKKYNGWTNYETWNVALWIGGDEALYKTSRNFKSYKAFISETGLYDQKTMEGTAWNDPLINHAEMDEMLAEQHIDNKDY